MGVQGHVAVPVVDIHMLAVPGIGIVNRNHPPRRGTNRGAGRRGNIHRAVGSQHKRDRVDAVAELGGNRVIAPGLQRPQVGETALLIYIGVDLLVQHPKRIVVRAVKLAQRGQLALQIINPAGQQRVPGGIGGRAVNLQRAAVSGQDGFLRLQPDFLAHLVFDFAGLLRGVQHLGGKRLQLLQLFLLLGGDFLQPRIFRGNRLQPPGGIRKIAGEPKQQRQAQRQRQNRAQRQLQVNRLLFGMGHQHHGVFQPQPLRQRLFIFNFCWVNRSFSLHKIRSVPANVRCERCRKRGKPQRVRPPRPL